MKYHSVLSGDLKPEDFYDLAKVQYAVHQLADGLTCHDVCQEIAKQEPDTFCHIRGYFLKAEHSWLELKNRPLVIIDPYPWAAAHPQLITLEGLLNPWRWIYDPLPACIKNRNIYKLSLESRAGTNI